MTRRTVLIYVVGFFSTAWAAAVAAAFLTAGLAVAQADNEDFFTGSITNFVLLMILASIFAIAGVIVANGFPSMTLRRMAKVPVAGMGIILLVFACVGVMGMAFT